MKKILILLVILLCPAYSWAATINSASCSYADVSTAIASATTGDTVTIPPCSSTEWSTAITITNKTLIINGSGQGVTNLATAGANSMFRVSNSSSYNITIKNLTINATKGGASDGIIRLSGGMTAFVVQNITMSELTVRAITVYNQSYGVIAACTFNRKATGTGQVISIYGNGALSATAWSQADDFGTDKFVYIEGCTFNWTNAGDSVDAYGGARFVYRYNNFVDTIISWHGLDSGGYYSPRAFEIYNNSTVMNTGSKYFTGLHARGGTGYIYNNTWGGTVSFATAMRLANYRSTGDYQYWRTCDGSNWKACSNSSVPHACLVDNDCDSADLPTAGGSHSSLGTCSYYWNEGRTAVGAQNATYNYYFDINTDETGWPCANQIGRGQNNTSMPLYEYNNTLDGNDADFTSMTTHIQADRDYYNDTQKPDYTAYTCPHPLTGLAEGCTPGTAGIAGYNTGEDTTAPTCTFAVDSTGLIATGTCTESVDAVTKTGLSFTGSVTGAITATYKDGMPGANPRFDLGSEVQQSDVVTADYTTPGTGIKDAAGNALANFSGASVFNGSTQNTPPTYAVTINKTGTGCTITSSPSGANCGETCSVTVDSGTVVTLGGYLENGWASITYGGDCASNGTVTVNADKTCTVTCTPVYLLN